MSKLSRRGFVLGGAAVAAGALLARPADEGGPYPPYFAALDRGLKDAGIAHPVMVVDLDRVERNLARVKAMIGPHQTYRVVVKSLPSLPLLDHILAAAETRALMAFHQPFLNQVALARPDVDLLLGKPLPVRAAARFYREHRGAFDPARQLQWLVDAPARLAEYAALARGLGTKLRVNLEIDVGLHRGGFEPDAAFATALETIAADPDHLELAGFMGYEAHVAAFPGALGDRAFAAARRRYDDFLAVARESVPALVRADLTWNAAGSLTIHRYADDPWINDLSAGTCLLKPTHSDTDALAGLEPAAFIATPVLKRLAGTRAAGLEWASGLASAWNPNRAQTYFLYGGGWKAVFHAPPGLRGNALFGDSTNQGIANASDAVPLQVDDFVFLRPTQSEFVLLQFGDLVVTRGARVVDRWPVLQNLA